MLDQVTLCRLVGTSPRLHNLLFCKCHKGVLGEFGVCRPCKCLLCGHNGHLRLGQDHLWLCYVRGGVVRV